jgi:hypothetical protein
VTAGDRGEDPRIGQGRGIAFALQLELAFVDAARHVGGQHEQQVGILGSHAWGAGQQNQKRQRGKSRSHRVSP